MTDTIITITWKVGSKPVLGRRVQARPWRNRTLERQPRRQTWKFGFKISPEIFHDKHQQAIVGRPCKRESTLVVHGRVDVEDVFRVFLDQRLHERLIQNECQIKSLAIACMMICDQMKLKTRPIKCIAFILSSCKVIILQYLRPFHKRFNPLWSFLFQSCFHPWYYIFNIDPRNIAFLSSSLINLYQSLIAWI